MCSHETYRPDAEGLAMFEASRAGQFPHYFACREIKDGVAAALGVDRSYLVRLGERMAKALSTHGNEAKASANLQRLIRQIVKDFWVGENEVADEYYLHFLCAIQAARSKRMQGRSCEHERWARIFGLVIGAVELMHKRGVSLELDVIIFLVKREESASVTDIKNAICYYTRSANLKMADWLSPNCSLSRVAPAAKQPSKQG
jgi:hypothetical protein